MNQETETAVAEVVEIKTFRGMGKDRVNQYRLVKVKCPYCGEIHTHGGGPTTEPLEQWLSYRAPHCTDGKSVSRPCYKLVNVHGER